MRDHSNHIQVTRDQAISLLLESCEFDPKTEIVPVESSIGRILAVDVVAQLDMPNARTCKLDSIAVRWDDFVDGMPDTSSWERGRDWQFANTGIGMPEGFDTAIVIEHVELGADESIKLNTVPSKQFAGTTPAGSRMHKGQVLVEANTKVTPLLAAHIASGNNAYVEVIRKPVVAFIPTGNELVVVGDDLPAGKNIESNSILIKNKIVAWGGEPYIFPIVRDEQDGIKNALIKATKEADIVILNAGSSKGSDDWNLECIEDIGRVLYHQTNHGPGHHSSGSVMNNTPIIGISGPPGGAAFTTDFYVWPVMRKFLHQSTEPEKMIVRLKEEFPAFKKPNAGPVPGQLWGEMRPAEGGTFYSIKRLVLKQNADGVFEAHPTKSGKPGPVEAETANAYYPMPSGENSKTPKAGDLIEVTLRPGFGFMQ